MCLQNLKDKAIHCPLQKKSWVGWVIFFYWIYLSDINYYRSCMVKLQSSSKSEETYSEYGIEIDNLIWKDVIIESKKCE